jgi:hypothetical protein
LFDVKVKKKMQVELVEARHHALENLAVGQKNVVE